MFQKFQEGGGVSPRRIEGKKIMSSKAKCYEKAEKLGYIIDEDYEQIRLEAPKGFCWSQDIHETISEYWIGEKGTMSKANAWKTVWSEIGTAEPCEIVDCEWCGSNV
jgi:hypothetical protein